MSQAELPFEKLPGCVVCALLKGSFAEIPIKVFRLQDSQGTEYLQLLVPTCEEHQHMPSIHYRPKGERR